jgi:isoamyl acetate esterase
MKPGQRGRGKKGVHPCLGCHFGDRRFGTYNVAIEILFDDGVEWIAKIPKNKNHDGEEVPRKVQCARLSTEIGALQFLGPVPEILVPRIRGFSLSYCNPIGAPFILMDKMGGGHLTPCASMRP